MAVDLHAELDLIAHRGHKSGYRVVKRDKLVRHDAERDYKAEREKQ